MTRSSKILWVLALAGGLVAIAFPVPLQSAWAQVPTGQNQSVLAGSRVFGTRGCSACHAINGLGGGLVPDLGSSERPESFYGFAAAMRNHVMISDELGRGTVTGPTFTADGTADVAAYLQTIGRVR